MTTRMIQNILAKQRTISSGKENDKVTDTFILQDTADEKIVLEDWSVRSPIATFVDGQRRMQVVVEDDDYVLYSRLPNARYEIINSWPREIIELIES